MLAREVQCPANAGSGRPAMGQARQVVRSLALCPLRVESFERVAKGELDHLPEQAFYMKGGIDEVIAAGAEMVD